MGESLDDIVESSAVRVMVHQGTYRLNVHFENEDPRGPGANGRPYDEMGPGLGPQGPLMHGSGAGDMNMPGPGMNLNTVLDLSPSTIDLGPSSMPSYGNYTSMNDLQSSLPDIGDKYFVSRHIDNQYGQHENKLIDYGTETVTSVYTDFSQDGYSLSIGHNDFNKHHRKKRIGWEKKYPY